MDPIRRDRVVRQTLRESALLAVLCGVGGLLLARWLVECARVVLSR